MRAVHLPPVVRVVAQTETVQVEGLPRGVVDLYPSAIVPAGIHELVDVGRHHLIDPQVCNTLCLHMQPNQAHQCDNMIPYALHGSILSIPLFLKRRDSH